MTPMKDHPWMPKDFYETVELPIKQFMVSRMMTEDMPANLIKIVVRRLEHAFQITMRVDMPTKTLGQWEWPRTWWDAVKERFAPAWFLKRWPVVYCRVLLGEALAKEIPRGFGPIFRYVEFNGELQDLFRDGEDDFRRQYMNEPLDPGPVR